MFKAIGWIGGLYLCLGLILPAWLWGETKPAAPKPPPIVTVIQNDGSTVRGTISSIDPRNVVIQPLAKPKETPPPAVTISWKEIKSVTNGMTQKRMLAQWKKEHPEQLCETCKGELTVRCDVCKGTMHDPASAKDCKTCGGELLIDCKAPQCDHGKVPCPAPCLKLTQGTWVKKEDGLRWRKLTGSGGYTAEVSEHHLGELVVFHRDAAPELKKCPTCNGTTKADCPTCQGTGLVPCPECLARKAAPPCPNHCDKGRVPCPVCDGVGLKKS